MLNPNPDKGIDSILNLNPESTSLVDVPVSTNVEMPPSSVTSLLSPPIPFIQPQQQTHVPTPTIVPSTSLQNLPTFGSLFEFEDKVKALEDPSWNSCNKQLMHHVSSIPHKLRDEAQAENENFINTLDENMRKIIKKQVKEQIKEQVSKILSKIKKFVNDQLKAEILTRSSNQAKTSHVVAANQSELKLKKILIDKIENNKSIDNQFAGRDSSLQALDYGHINGLRLVPTQCGLNVRLFPDKTALWGILMGAETSKQFYGFAVIQGICSDDDKLYKFKEGGFNRLHIQDIEDMLLLLVQGKLINLTVEERLAFNVSLRMFTRSVVIQRRVEDLQLGVESYQKKLNLTKSDTLMRIDELHKFSDDTLNDVRTALDDRLKGIRMKYLPQTIWRKSGRDKAGAMIQAIDKQLKTRRIMRSLEKFVG
ncbi:hypothetical protein Tco_1343736 [Tanacetum coccineum]